MPVIKAFRACCIVIECVDSWHVWIHVKGVTHRAARVTAQRCVDIECCHCGLRTQPQHTAPPYLHAQTL